MAQTYVRFITTLHSAAKITVLFTLILLPFAFMNMNMTAAAKMLRTPFMVTGDQSMILMSIPAKLKVTAESSTKKVPDFELFYHFQKHLPSLHVRCPGIGQPEYTQKVYIDKLQVF